MNKLHAISSGMRGMKITPQNISRNYFTIEQSQWLENHALSIFTDCANVGLSFGECLGAIYLSGLENGSEIIKRKKK